MSKKVYTVSNLILHKIGEIGLAAIEGFFPAKYPEARLWRNILGFDEKRKFSRENFLKLLSRLQRQGLVERKGRGSSAQWRLTGEGSRHIQGMNLLKILPDTDSTKRIVIFDIPEKDRKKRRWIRAELLAHEYEPLQKSVWVGYRPLSQEFIDTLDFLRVKKYVHVFSVHNSGTLEDGKRVRDGRR